MADKARKKGDCEGEAHGNGFAEMWRCPNRGSALRESTEHLPPNCRTTIDRVERLTGARSLCTCPLYYTRLDWVHEAALLRARRDQNILALTNPNLDSIQVDCMEAIDVGYGARMQHEADEREAKAEHDALEAKHNAIGRRVGSLG
jgi:hypothetical protein